jgi:hypothetical protein
MMAAAGRARSSFLLKRFEKNRGRGPAWIADGSKTDRQGGRAGNRRARGRILPLEIAKIFKRIARLEDDQAWRSSAVVALGRALSLRNSCVGRFVWRLFDPNAM